jgi:hypothetical protein
MSTAGHDPSGRHQPNGPARAYFVWWPLEFSKRPIGIVGGGSTTTGDNDLRSSA